MPVISDHEFTIFSAARKLALTERPAFLKKVCAGDASLHQRIDDLLQIDEQTPVFMENGAAGIAPTEKPGDRIGRYNLIEQIGEGGCGLVYLAEQDEPVRRRVALKVIKLGMDTKSVIARFEAERQALALMDHPNIAKVFDAGATSGGRPFFVMELVAGVKITDFCDQNQLSIRQRLELFVQVCQAIQHAHQKGIIHRDIKPSNVLVAKHDEAPFPKVIDFGIAKATHGKLTDETYFTAFEQFLGTPAYMSPEQAEAGGMDVDTRSDIYSLGVLLYELLTGRTPFDSKQLRESSIDAIRHILQQHEPDTPSMRLRTLQGEAQVVAAKQRKIEAFKLINQLRGDLDWIVMKALERERARRYETANGFAADIRRYLDNEPVMARPPSATYRFQKLVRRNKWVFAAVSGTVAALALGVALSVRFSIKEHQARLETEKERRQAQANEKKAQIEAAKNRQVAQFLEDMLNGVGPTVATGSDTTLLRKILDNTAQRIGTDLSQQPEVEAELRYTLGEVYWELGDMENAQAMHEKALALRRTSLGESNPQVAQSMRRLAHVLWREGRLDEAEKMGVAGVQMQRQLFGDKNLEVARSLEDLAAIYNTKNEPSAVEKTLREAVFIKRALLGDDNLEVADSMGDLGYWLFSRKYKTTEAFSLARKATEIRTKLLGADNPIVTMASLRLQATEFDTQAKSPQEEAALKKLIDVQRKVLGIAHPNLARSLVMLASVLRTEDRNLEAAPLLHEALEMQRKLLGEENPEVAKTEALLADQLMTQNTFSGAEPLYRNAFTTRRKIFGPYGSQVTDPFVSYGQMLEKQGKFEEAKSLYLRESGDKTDLSLMAQYCLGVLLLESPLKDVPEGLKWLRSSANLGNSRAAIKLGVLYFEGVEIPKDETLAEAWFHKAALRGNTQSVKTQADCYCAAGRIAEALAAEKNAFESHPKDIETALKYAAWEVWFGKEKDYEKTRLRILLQAEQSQDAPTMHAGAKAYSLCASTNTDGLAAALRLAQRAVELRKGTPFLPWYQLSLGMVQYRCGRYAEAETTLAAAGQAIAKYPDLPATARLYRAMSLFQLGHAEKARAVFQDVDKEMIPLPQDDAKPMIDGKIVSNNLMICWLAYKEAKSLLSQKDGIKIADERR